MINPSSILTNVMVQFSDQVKTRLYDSSSLTSDTGFDVINFSTPLDISTLDQIDIWYDDLLGNRYDIIWR